jgi:hypothetical protein
VDAPFETRYAAIETVGRHARGTCGERRDQETKRDEGAREIREEAEVICVQDKESCVDDLPRMYVRVM